MDKRKRDRKYLIAKVQINKVGEGVRMGASAVNISRGGMCIYTSKTLDVRDKIKVKVSISVKGAPLVSESVPGTVCWILPIDKKYAVGVKFEDDIDAEDFPLLAKCLEYTKRN